MLRRGGLRTSSTIHSIKLLSALTALCFVLYQEGGQETFGDKVPWWSRAAIYPGGPGRYLDNSPFESYFKMENHRSNACTGDPVGAKADMLLS